MCGKSLYLYIFLFQAILRYFLTKLLKMVFSSGVIGSLFGSDETDNDQPDFTIFSSGTRLLSENRNEDGLEWVDYTQRELVFESSFEY